VEGEAPGESLGEQKEDLARGRHSSHSPREAEVGTTSVYCSAVTTPRARMAASFRFPKTHQKDLSDPAPEQGFQ
jgi:hypothetical protein